MAWNILVANGPWYHLSMLNFLLSACVHDLLYLRLFLFLAETFMCLWSFSGVPKWPHASSDIGISLDGVLWSAGKALINLYLVVRMLKDHYKVSTVQFSGDERDEALWRALHRRTGISRMDMKSLLKLGEWMEEQEGTIIQDGSTLAGSVYIIYLGAVSIGVTPAPHEKTNPSLGQARWWTETGSDLAVVDLKPLQQTISLDLGVPAGRYTVIASTDVVLYRLPSKALANLAAKRPNLRTAFRTLVVMDVFSKLCMMVRNPTAVMDGSASTAGGLFAAAGGSTEDLSGPGGGEGSADKVSTRSAASAASAAAMSTTGAILGFAPPPLGRVTRQRAKVVCDDCKELEPSEAPTYSLWSDFKRAWNLPFSYTPGMRASKAPAGTQASQAMLWGDKFSEVMVEAEAEVDSYEGSFHGRV